MNADFYRTTKTCPACERSFGLIRPRSSACTVVNRDSDFRVQYGRVDANLYSVWVCPHCGYAASETTFESLEPRERQVVRAALQDRSAPSGIEGERTPDAAIAAYEQAIYLASHRKLSPSNLAGLHLKLAWVYRGLEDKEKELLHLSSARDLYLSAFNGERLGGPGKMSEIAVAFLVGELSRRIGDYSAAISWFSRLVSDPRSKVEPQIVALARDQWYRAKQQAAGGGRGLSDAPQENEAATEAGVPSQAPAQSATSPNRAVPSDRRREGKISSMIPLYRDQVEWLQLLINRSDDSRLVLADAVRAILDLVILSGPPDRLTARNEHELREKLATLFRPADGE